ncbi:MAG: hypothetical protein ACRDL7_15735 [Gaiellaceae bacterium]
MVEEKGAYRRRIVLPMVKNNPFPNGATLVLNVFSERSFSSCDAAPHTKLKAEIEGQSHWWCATLLQLLKEFLAVEELTKLCAIALEYFPAGIHQAIHFLPNGRKADGDL